MPLSGGGYNVMQSQYQHPPQDYMQQHIIHQPTPQYTQGHEHWTGVPQFYNYTQSGHWSPSQDSYSSIASTQPYTYDMHTAVVPSMHMASMSAYPGMPNSQVSQVLRSDVRPEMSRSTSSISAYSETVRAKADNGKFSSSETVSKKGQNHDLLSKKASSQTKTQKVQHTNHSILDNQKWMNDEEDDPNDPWDIDSDYDIDDAASLIPSRPSQRFILDERMAYLMSHFCNYLRPCISLWERPVIFNGSSTLAEKIPALSMSCRGLLHGVMAVSALHLAILHRTSEMIPLKHFVIASNNLTRLIQSPNQRHRVETLALCLLLAFYSVILGDHSKWVMHMKGCSSFLMEHDFAAFQRFLWKQRMTNKETRSTDRRKSVAESLESEWPLNESLIKNLTGMQISYANHHQQLPLQIELAQLSQSDMQDWRARIDLMAWFLKMDIFQAMLSGDGLLLPYQSWKYFTPRGNIGQIENVHATMDHLLLVLGRLADFGAQDRTRKQRKVTENGGEWQPEPGFLAGGPPKQSDTTQQTHKNGANEGRARASSKSDHQKVKNTKQPSLFYGMMPPSRIPPSMLSSFHIIDHELQSTTAQAASKDLTNPKESIPVCTEKALLESASIAEALNTWKASLPRGFDLSIHESSQSPFGTSLRHPDPTVACMWSFYYLARILLRRYHPHSPPAMMISSRVNAPYTHNDALIIGKIFVGLLEAQQEMAKAGSINPTLVATLQEVTFPIMFAGVQYKDSSVRTCMIDSLMDVGQESGWKTAFSVATALEAAWSAQGGYEKTMSARSPQDAKRYVPETESEGETSSSAADTHTRRFDAHDRRLLDRFSDLRAFWAVGVLSTPDDVAKIFDKLKVGD